MGVSVGFFIFSVAMNLLVSHAKQKRAERAMQRLKDSLSQDQDVGFQLKANTRGTNESKKVIYGRLRVGGNNFYVSTAGENNYDLYFGHSIAEGPNEGIVNDENSNPYIWFDGERIHEKYADLYEYNEKVGTSDQIQDTLINTAIEDFTDPMHYTGYTAWHLTYDEDVYRGIPNIQYLYDGRLLYDFRDETTTWSDNPVLALYDFFTNGRYGLDYDPETLDLDSWEEAADYCDTKEFKINMEISATSSTVWSTITNILNLFRGDLNYWDGKYYLRFRDLNEEVSVMTIQDEHILQDSSGRAMVTLSEPGYYDTPDGLEVTFINSENNLYIQDSFIVGEEEGIIARFNAIGCTDRKMAGILAISEFERQLLTRTISGRFRDDCLILEPNDIITFNSTALNIENQVMRVNSAVYTNVGFIDLVLQYESTDLYDDIFNINPESLYKTNLPDPSEPAVIHNPTITESTYTQRLRTFSRLNISFTVPENSWFKHVEVYVSVEGNVDENYKHQFNAKDNFTIDPVEEGQTYYLILRTVNIWGVKQSLGNSTRISRKVTGISDQPPSSLTYLEASTGDGTVSLRSTKLDDPNIEIYEFRLGLQWMGAIHLSSKRSPIEFLGLVRPGNHAFWCNTKGTNNIYGLYPQTANVTVPIASGWSLYTSFEDDYSDSTAGQVFNNIQGWTYDSSNWLRGTHNEDSPYVDSTAVIPITYLMGQYISEEFDTGVAAASYYVFLDVDFLIVGEGTEWEDLFTWRGWGGQPADFNPGDPPLEYDEIMDSDTTWEQANAHIYPWRVLFEVTEAPKVVIRIWYKSEAGHDWSYLENAQILAGVITGRYFKVEVKIEDPSRTVCMYVKEYSLKLYN